MKSSTREKTIRNIIASVLSSDLSERELNELAESFMMRDSLILEIGMMLKDFSSRLSSLNHGRRIDLDETEITSSPLSSSEVAELVKAAGIPQVELLHIIGEVSPELANALSHKRLTTTALIERIFRDISPNRRQRILKTISLHVKARNPIGDPYLDLITNKLNRSDVSE